MIAAGRLGERKREKEKERDRDRERQEMDTERYVIWDMSRENLRKLQ